MAHSRRTRKKAPTPDMLDLFGGGDLFADDEAPDLEVEVLAASAPWPLGTAPVSLPPLQRADANVIALMLLRKLQGEGRPATEAERVTLARWTGWGAIPQVFDRQPTGWAAATHARLAQMLSPVELRAANDSILNAHYTDPAIAAAMWDGARRLGFTGGEALEPGCGAGLIMGLAPAGTRMTGVEVDPVTAAIAQMINPGADVRQESFAATSIPAGYFDLVIGNVPFGKFPMAEACPVCPECGEMSIHNACMYKALHLLRPGGLMLVLTSRYTLDAGDDDVRKQIAGLADLVGAVRLPEGAHQAAAGTKVVMDLLVFRRREPGQLGTGGLSWTQAVMQDIGGHRLEVSQVYGKGGGGHVLGQLAAGTSAYGPVPTVLAEPGADLGAALTAALSRIAVDANAGGLGWAPRTEPRPEPLGRPDASLIEGHITARLGGTFTQVGSGRDLPLAVPGTRRLELGSLLALRDTVLALLDAESVTVSDTPETDQLRARLNQLYDAYAKRYGPLNRFTLRPTGKLDKGTGEPTYARVRANQGGFRTDPESPIVYALEKFDSASQTAEKAAIFGGRVICRREPATTAGSPAEALHISMDVHGRPHLGHIARLLGLAGEDEALAAVAALTFPDPEQDGALVPREEYLSGNVRKKLAAATAAAMDDPRYRACAVALRDALPADLGPEQVKARLGSPWIPARDVQTFLQVLLNDRNIRVDHPGGSWWQIAAGWTGSVLYKSTWGTERMVATDLAEAMLCQRTISVYDTFKVPGGGDRRVLNAEATALAQEKAKELNARFTEWIWSDPERAERLCRIYNDLFNSIVLREYDSSPMDLPGLASWFVPKVHPHQYAAVRRIVGEPAAGLFHVVGAGKTASMAMGAMELKRLGLIQTACVVVPNQLLEQFTREWLQFYPQARVLATSSEDLAKEGRLRLRAQVATGQWDAVIMTQSAFERIPMSKDAWTAYYMAEIDYLAGLENMSNGMTAKAIARARKRCEKRLADKLDGAADPGLTFQKLGLDYLVIDEAHHFKNLHTVSAIQGAGIDGSKRASDLHMKLDYLRTQHDRVATFATATPIANSITEMHVMMRYMRPDVLATAGVSEFDAWAGAFGETVARVEMAPEGGSAFRLKERFAKFVNVPELLRQFWIFADVKVAEDLNLKVPLISAGADGIRGPRVIAVEPDPALVEFVIDLGERATLIRNRDPRKFQRTNEDGTHRTIEDNMLLVSTDGRKAAIDLRMVGREQTEPGKLSAVTANVLDVHRRHPGKLQIVFCDLGTPRLEWNAYDEIALDLIASGLRVRYIHSARNDLERADLFAACRAGGVDVILGSTGKMGTGVNIQDLCVALHHVDPPWRPADVEQRDGRAIRQGNLCPEVEVWRYVTVRSFDGYMWQTLATKATFIGQVLRGRLDAREIDDISEVAMSANAARAIAFDNPLVLEEAEAIAELQRLQRSARGHQRTQDGLAWTIRRHEREIKDNRERIEYLAALLDRREDTSGEHFHMIADGLPTDVRADAGKRLLAVMAETTAALSERMESWREELDTKPFQAGWLAGFPVMVGATGWKITLLREGGKRAEWHAEPSISLDGIPDSTVTLRGSEMQDADPAGLVVRLENRAGRLEGMIGDRMAAIARSEGEIAAAGEHLGQSFQHEAELEEAAARVQRLAASLAEAARLKGQGPERMAA